MKGLAGMICLRELRREEDMICTRVVIPSSLFSFLFVIPLFLAYSPLSRNYITFNVPFVPLNIAYYTICSVI